MVYYWFINPHSYDVTNEIEELSGIFDVSGLKNWFITPKYPDEHIRFSIPPKKPRLDGFGQHPAFPPVGCTEKIWSFSEDLPSGKRLHNDGKIHHF